MRPKLFRFHVDPIVPPVPQPDVYWTRSPVSGWFYLGLMTGAYLITIGLKVAPSRF